MEEKNQSSEIVTSSNKVVDKKSTSSLLYNIKKNGLHTSPWMTFLRVCIFPFVRPFFPFKMIGDYKAKNGACVYVSNHYTTLDPMYLLPTTKEGIHFISKKEASEMPILGFFIKKVKVIPVSRDGNDARAIMNGLKCLKHGDKLAVYPEGKRNQTDAPFLPFKSGSALFAIRAKVPVIPVVIYRKAKMFRMNYIIFGEPFEFTQYYDCKITDEILKEADDILLEKMTKLWNDHHDSLEAKKVKKLCK